MDGRRDGELCRSLFGRRWRLAGGRRAFAFHAVGLGAFEDAAAGGQPANGGELADQKGPTVAGPTEGDEEILLLGQDTESAAKTILSLPPHGYDPSQGRLAKYGGPSPPPETGPLRTIAGRLVAMNPMTTRARLVLCVAGLCIWMAGFACTTGPAATLRVATLNIAHGRGLASSQVWLKRSVFEANLDAIADTLNREAPDVVALQEVDAPSAWSGRFDHLARIADATGFPHRYHGLHFDATVLKTNVKYGTALLSGRPLASPSSLEFDAKVVGSKGFTTAEIEFGGRSLLVASVHLNWYSTRIRLRQARQVVKALERTELPILLMGDFNCQWNDDDALRTIANQLNLQSYTPDANKLNTFPAHAPNTRIDWILTSPELEFVTYRVCPDRVSDHLAVIADVRWVRPQARSRH